MANQIEHTEKNTLLLLCGTDPYLNTDAGTMSPFEHGEVFVLDDGGEVRSLIRRLGALPGQGPSSLDARRKKAAGGGRRAVSKNGGAALQRTACCAASAQEPLLATASLFGRQGAAGGGAALAKKGVLLVVSMQSRFGPLGRAHRKGASAAQAAVC